MAIPVRSYNSDIIPRKLIDPRALIHERANLVVELGVVARHLGMAIGKKLSRYQVNYNLWQVLVSLWSGTAVTPEAAAQQLQVEPATISRYLDQLETQGYISRERSKADRRVVDIVITPKGEKVVKIGLKELDNRDKNFV